MTGDFDEGYTLVTDNEASTSNVITFNGTGISEDLANTEVEVTLTNMSGVTEDDFTNSTDGYYNDKPENYKTYLTEAIKGNNPFAYIMADNSTDTVRLQDAAQWKLNDNKEIGMVIPGDFPQGTYELTFTLEDTSDNSNQETYTFDLTVSR
ncbi:hypothetical protein GLW05_11745 [Pontibacillus yanchengensis]|uniref:Uncharacterized protein n=1 Tax=Pontibacillus yanchengensis TaxID=462910 RepID=A0A6I5A3J4_9BACI|nr:hypothetical protein [Pontibacillus yanchengensis]MYL34271.1 hypothetical protein [Pontibacillus yanchengensis]